MGQAVTPGPALNCQGDLTIDRLMRLIVRARSRSKHERTYIYSLLSLLTSRVISNTVENMNTRLWKKILPKMKTKQLLPKDIKLLEWLEKGGRPGGDEDFLKLLKLVSTPLPKQKS